jgi:carbamoyl-phosphate synthase large subunit
MKALITAIGKRVQLIRYLREELVMVGVDSGELVPAEGFVDKFYRVPKCNDENFIEKILEICKNEKIDIIIPLYEKEFSVFIENRNKFENLKTFLMLSNKKVIDICNNKWSTYCFFKENNINTPDTYLGTDDINAISYPVIIKPADGMGSSNVFKVNNRNELEFFKNYVKNCIIQEYIEGIEYTIDVLCDLGGNVISIVPRERIEVRSGEVSKSKTVKRMDIVDATLNLCNKLKLASLKEEISLVGPLTIQCIINKNNEIKFIEINPRFGGGVPLSIEAGINYGKYFKEMVEGRKIKAQIGEFREITMLRYDEAIFK